MNKSTKSLLGLAVVLGLFGCGTLKTDDIQVDDIPLGNENQEGDVNVGQDSNQGVSVDNGSVEDSNEGVAPVNQGSDVNTGDIVPPQNGDTDGDGILDIDDADIDGDGINNIDDADIDGDGVNNIDDNDIDGDGIANAGDNDIDGDGIANIDDTDIDGDGVINEEDVDVDGDGIVNTEDGDIDGDGLPNSSDGDIDGDGVLNTEDPDIDGDGLNNDVDPDIDGDGINNDVDPDIDGDGIDNGSDPDADGDGINENTDIDAGVTVKVDQLDTTDFETFTGAQKSIVFNHTVDLNDIRQEIADEGLQLGTVQIDDLTITMVMDGGAPAFVTNHPNNAFTLDGRENEGTKQQVIYSISNGLVPTQLVDGISKNENELFVNATGWTKMNAAIQDPGQATVDIEIELIFTEELDQDYQLSFAFKLSVVGKKII